MHLRDSRPITVYACAAEEQQHVPLGHVKARPSFSFFLLARLAVSCKYSEVRLSLLSARPFPLASAPFTTTGHSLSFCLWDCYFLSFLSSDTTCLTISTPGASFASKRSIKLSSHYAQTTALHCLYTGSRNDLFKIPLSSLFLQRMSWDRHRCLGRPAVFAQVIFLVLPLVLHE